MGIPVEMVSLRSLATSAILLPFSNLAADASPVQQSLLVKGSIEKSSCWHNHTAVESCPLMAECWYYNNQETDWSPSCHECWDCDEDCGCDDGACTGGGATQDRCQNYGCC